MQFVKDVLDNDDRPEVTVREIRQLLIAEYRYLKDISRTPIENAIKKLGYSYKKVYYKSYSFDDTNLME